MIKTIIFDIGGVITKTDFGALYANFGKRIGLSEGVVERYHKERMADLLLGNISLEKFWEDIKQAGADPRVDPEDVWLDEGIKSREINKELLDIIKKLRKNYSVGALTNLTHSRRILDEKDGLYEHFDYTILSCEKHLKKPDPKFYELALTAASASPEEAVFIDDTLRHAEGARAARIAGIVYTYPDNGTLLKDLRMLGVNI
jgi:epoxide hydrolase-like predicted phosphatase